MDTRICTYINAMLLKTSLIMIEKQSIPFFDRYVSVFNNIHDTKPSKEAAADDDYQRRVPRRAQG